METTLTIHLEALPVPTSVRFTTHAKNFKPPAQAPWAMPAATPASMPSHPPLPGEVRGDLQLNTLTSGQLFDLCQEFVGNVFKGASPGSYTPQLIRPADHVTAEPAANGVLRDVLDLILMSPPSSLGKGVVMLCADHLTSIGHEVPTLSGDWALKWPEITADSHGAPELVEGLTTLLRTVHNQIEARAGMGTDTLGDVVELIENRLLEWGLGPKY